MKRLSLFTLFLLLPAIVFAATPAGFAPGAIWLSKTGVTAGEQVTIYTVVYDSLEEDVEGVLSFLVDEESISKQTFKLAAGETKILSAPWTSTKGAHRIGASLDEMKTARGEVLALDRVATEAVEVEIIAPPTPSIATQATGMAVSAIQTGAPVVVGAVKGAFDSLEYLRKNAVYALQDALGSTTSAATSPAAHENADAAYSTSSAVVVGTTSATPSPNPIHAGWQAFLSALLYICRVQFLFYIAIFLTLYIFYKLLRYILIENRYPY